MAHPCAPPAAAAAAAAAQPKVPTKAETVPTGYVRDGSGYHYNPFTKHYFDVNTSFYFIMLLAAQSARRRR